MYWGFSMGSFAAQKLVLDHPDKISLLILYGASCGRQDGTTLLDKIISPKDESNGLIDLFEQGKEFISIETKSNLDGQHQGQIIDTVWTLE